MAEQDERENTGKTRCEIAAITVHLIRDTDDELYAVYKAIKDIVGDDNRSETRLNLGVRPRAPRGQALGA